MRKLLRAVLLASATTSIAGCAPPAETSATGTNDTVLLNDEGGTALSEANASSDDSGANLFNDALEDPQASLGNSTSINTF